MSTTKIEKHQMRETEYLKCGAPFLGHDNNRPNSFPKNACRVNYQIYKSWKKPCKEAIPQ